MKIIMVRGVSNSAEVVARLFSCHQDVDTGLALREASGMSACEAIGSLAGISRGDLQELDKFFFDMKKKRTHREIGSSMMIDSRLLHDLGVDIHVNIARVWE